MLINYIGEYPEFTVDGMRVPEFAVIRAREKKSTLSLYRASMMYLYFLYHMDSPYRNMLMSDKKKVLDSDYMTPRKLVKCEELEKDNEVQAAVKKFRMLTYTTKERLIDSWNNRVDKIMKFWEDMPLNNAVEARDSATQLKQIKELLQFREYIDNLKNDVTETELYGGGTVGLFEFDGEE